MEDSAMSFRARAARCLNKARLSLKLSTVTAVAVLAAAAITAVMCEPGTSYLNTLLCEYKAATYTAALCVPVLAVLVVIWCVVWKSKDAVSPVEVGGKEGMALVNMSMPTHAENTTAEDADMPPTYEQMFSTSQESLMHETIHSSDYPGTPPPPYMSRQDLTFDDDPDIAPVHLQNIAIVDDQMPRPQDSDFCLIDDQVLRDTSTQDCPHYPDPLQRRP